MSNQTERATIDLVINGQQSEASLKSITAATINARKALSSLAETDPGYKRQKKELEALMQAQQNRIVRINQEKTAWQQFKANSAGMMAGVTGGNLITTAIQKTLDIIPNAIMKFRAYESASADMSANLGLDAKAVEYFNQKARETGPAFGKSAAEMLEGYKLVGSANSDLIKTPELLEDVTKKSVALSQASKMNLADATASLVGSMNQFDAAADQSERFINVMAGGAQVGSAEIADMAMSLKASGIVAHQAGLSFEETNGALQSLSKESLKGEQAGTMFRNILLELQKGSNDTNPAVVGLDKALENLSRKNMSTAQAAKLFGKENVTAALSLINHRDRVAEFTKGLTGTSAAYDMAAKNNATWDHQLEITGAKLDAIAVWVGTKFMPAMASGLGSINGWIDKLPQLWNWLSKNGEWLLLTGVPSLLLYNGAMIKATASALANTVAEGYRRAAYQAGFAWLVISETATKTYALATGVLTGQISLQTAVVTIARNVWAAFSAVLLANPIGIVVGAMAGLIAAAKYFSEHTKAALDVERQKQALQRQGVQDTQQSTKALEGLNAKMAQYNGLSKAEQEEIKKVIALKALEARARLSAAYARAREVARAEGTQPNFWQGMKQGAADFVTGNWSKLGGQGLAQRQREQAEANKASAYAEAKELGGVDQLKADLEQYDRLLEQTNQKKKKTTGGGGNGPTEDEKKKAAKKAEDLDKMLADARTDALKAEQSDYEKSVFAFAEKYTKMYELAGTNSKKIEEIQRLSLLEMGAIEKRRNQEEIKNRMELESAKLEQFKDNAENRIELEVQMGLKTRAQGDTAKLTLEAQYLDASELLNRAYYKTLEDLSGGSADKLEKINTEKQAALLKIEKDRLANAAQQKEDKRKPIDNTLEEDLTNLQRKHDQELLSLKEKGKKQQLTDVELKNAELAIERNFLSKKQQLIEQHYQVLSRLGVLSAEEQKSLERQKNQESLQLGEQLLNAEQQQYEGRLGKVLKFLDEKQQYMTDAATILEGFFRVDQNKLNVGVLLDELDQLQHKTNLTSSEQERMKTIIGQVGQMMPGVVSGTDAYGKAIAINTDAARQEVEGQKHRASVMQKIMLAEKAWALASVGITYGQALMAAIKSSIGIPFPGNLAAVATSMAIPTLNLGVAITKIASTKIDAPAFAEGGFTSSDAMPAGFTTGATYYKKRNFIAGEAGQEYIIPRPMLRNPVIANLAGALEAMRTSGAYRSAVEARDILGMGMDNQKPGQAGGQNGGQDTFQQLLQQMQIGQRQAQAHFQQTIATVNATGNRPVVLNYRLQEEYENQVQQIRNDTKL